jgi:hypothetical protein
MAREIDSVADVLSGWFAAPIERLEFRTAWALFLLAPGTNACVERFSCCCR